MHDTSEDKDHHVNSSGLVLQKNIIKDIFYNEVCALTPFVTPGRLLRSYNFDDFGQ